MQRSDISEFYRSRNRKRREEKNKGTGVNKVGKILAFPISNCGVQGISWRLYAICKTDDNRG